MPNYDYRAVDPEKACDTCRENFEVFQHMKDDALAACPDCGASVQRIIGAAGIVTKTTASKLSDQSLKRAGFKKFVKEGDGKYRNVLAD